jgi:hypothetical protein
VKRSPKHKTLLLVGLAAILAGGTAAVVVAAAGSDHQSQSTGTIANRTDRRGHAGGRGDVALAASYLGLAPAQIRRELRSGKTLAQVAASTSGKSVTGLIDAIVTARKTQLAAAVAAGRLTKSQAHARLEKLTRRVTLRVNRAHALEPRPAALPGLVPAAAYLGLRPAQLRSELRSGRTLAQVADATGGKSAAGLIAALVAVKKAKLAADVAAGRLSQTDENKLLPHLEHRIAAEVNGQSGRLSGEARP